MYSYGGVNETFIEGVFKKNDTVKFKYQGKFKTGKIIKLGKYGVDVSCNGKFFYCHDWDNRENYFRKSNETRNYK